MFGEVVLLLPSQTIFLSQGRGEARCGVGGGGRRQNSDLETPTPAS